MDGAILYFSRNPIPRLAVAVARHLAAPVGFEWAAPLAPGEAERFRPLNPNLRLPILVEPGAAPLWEADAIACRLSQMAGTDFWRGGDAAPDMIRWLSWSKANFVDACDKVHFERGTKQRYRLGPVDAVAVAKGLAHFAESAAILEAHLTGRTWLVGDTPSYADFRMATFLPFNDAARLPVNDWPAIAPWADRLAALPAWSDPFAGLEAPGLPPVPSPT